MNQTSVRPSYKTPIAQKQDTTWYVVDAADKVLGRLATRIAHVLMGKHNPNFVKHWENGDHIVVINADKIVLTGNKWQQKKYYRHTGWVGHLKEKTAEKMKETKPEEIVRLAVKGMLPKNTMGRTLYGNLRVYAGAEHPHVAQKPTKLEF